MTDSGMDNGYPHAMARPRYGWIIEVAKIALNPIFSGSNHRSR